jgi:hypothetical protein
MQISALAKKIGVFLVTSAQNLCWGGGWILFLCLVINKKERKYKDFITVFIDNLCQIYLLSLLPKF